MLKKYKNLKTILVVFPTILYVIRPLCDKEDDEVVVLEVLKFLKLPNWNENGN